MDAINKTGRKIIAIGSMLIAAVAYGEGTNWAYSGEAGPENWGKLDGKYIVCEIGKNQSPVDLARFIEADLAPIAFAYSAGTTEIVNTGHTVQINYTPGSSITVEGNVFDLKQVHFHAPSENTVNGKHYPMEGHFVHADTHGNLAVVAVMFEEGATNELLTSLWTKMPGKAGKRSALPTTYNVAALLPAMRDYYRFNGSLTTPPCSEGVWWLVLKHPAVASKAQIEQFAKLMGHPNNRPVQSLNARPVLR